MADVLTPAQRHLNMSRIRGKDTKPEMLVRQYLHGRGLRYRLHVKGLPGKPDMVFPGLRTVVFIHGCFWHQHEGCRYFVVPKTRTDFWMEKIGRNVANDKRQQEELKNQGWRVLVVWECELRPLHQERTLERLFYSLTAPESYELEC
ncbi:very short patch repair endonuclease [Hymenobacter sp. ASUV-10]|uniref:Very short patch repair endonuclease n=1 Tax=Hymenobacter aranciens TaxID=3063996 RepID=A0ABT9B8Z4_9BACT|nr:very short patch repair endonuclease [Hymenobacter sp. ASUV-10]MDO7874726.1 very short patch repair endonuclease [Hymenobacter sp. ASUV-10]